MQDHKSTKSLGTESIPRLILRYSIPTIIAMTAMSLYNIVDSIFIGRGVGAMAISGLAITFPLMNLIMAFCTLIGIGGASIISIFLGQKEYGKASEVLSNTTALSIIVGAIIGIISLIFLNPILTLFGATESTISYAHEYMQVMVIFAPLSFILMGLNNIMRSTGHPIKAMITLLVSVIANIILTPLFIFTLDMGIRGAAIGTIVSQSITLVWLLLHFLNRDNQISLRGVKRWYNPLIARKILTIGLPPFMLNLFACIVVIFINKALISSGEGHIGELAVGSFGIINRTGMLSVMIVLGISQGIQPIIGYNYGAGNWLRVKRTIKIGVLAGLIINTIGWAACMLAPETISGFFTTDSQLISITKNAFHLGLIFWPLVGAQVIIQNFFQSIGKPKISIFLSTTRQAVILLPLLLILPPIMGIDGVWVSLSISDLCAFLLTLATFWVQIRKLNKQFTTQTL
ncbi:MAG: MATE family efflux transporter [Bacteroidales bacterium]